MLCGPLLSDGIDRTQREEPVNLQHWHRTRRAQGWWCLLSGRDTTKTPRPWYPPIFSIVWRLGGIAKRYCARSVVLVQWMEERWWWLKGWTCLVLFLNCCSLKSGTGKTIWRQSQRLDGRDGHQKRLGDEGRGCSSSGPRFSFGCSKRCRLSCRSTPSTGN